VWEVRERASILEKLRREQQWCCLPIIDLMDSEERRRFMAKEGQDQQCLVVGETARSNMLHKISSAIQLVEAGAAVEEEGR
jgi:hypothetical protein